MLLALLRRRGDLGYLTCEEALGELKRCVGRALHQDKGDGAGRVSRNPSDGVSRAGLDSLIPCWCSDHVETVDLSEDAAGGGQCQKAGLDKGILHI